MGVLVKPNTKPHATSCRQGNLLQQHPTSLLHVLQPATPAGIATIRTTPEQLRARSLGDA
jgi:hypothetical protein